MRVRTLSLIGLVGLIGFGATGCFPRPAILDTPFQPGEVEVLLEIGNNGDNSAKYDVMFGKESRGGTMTVMRGYQPNDPAYGFIIYRRTSGLL